MLGGWASLTIVGMMLKIVPFLVWYACTARVTVPTLAGLSCARGEAAAFALLVSGTSALAIAVALGDVVVVRVAGTLVALGALAFGATLARVLRHLRAPDEALVGAVPAELTS